MKRKNQYTKKSAIFALCVNLLCITTPVYPQQSIIQEKIYTFAKDFSLGGLATIGSYLASTVLFTVGSNFYYSQKNNQTNNNVSQKTKKYTSQKIIVAAGAVGIRLLAKFTYDLASKGHKGLCTKVYARNFATNIFGLAGGFLGSELTDNSAIMLLGIGLGNAIGGLATYYVLSK